MRRESKILNKFLSKAENFTDLNAIAVIVLKGIIEDSEICGWILLYEHCSLSNGKFLTRGIGNLLLLCLESESYFDTRHPYDVMHKLCHTKIAHQPPPFYIWCFVL